MAKRRQFCRGDCFAEARVEMAKGRFQLGKRLGHPANLVQIVEDNGYPANATTRIATIRSPCCGGWTDRT